MASRIGPDVAAAFTFLLVVIGLLLFGGVVLGLLWVCGVSPAWWMGCLCGGSVLGFVFAVLLGTLLNRIEG